MGRVLKVFIQILKWFRITFAIYRIKKLTDDEQLLAKKALGNLLGQSRGMTMKIGQLIAGIEVDDPFRSLVTSIEPIKLSKILSTLSSTDKAFLLNEFTELDESLAAASIGQVHRGILQNGNEVAIKIRYPGIVDAINAELTLVNWMPRAGPLKECDFNTSGYKQTLRKQLLTETDYLIEAETQQRFKNNLTIKGLWIPHVYFDKCKSNLLIQSWEQGCRIDEVCQWSKKDRLEVGRILLSTLFESLFVHGEIHGDPHMGNYLFRHGDDGLAVVILLDYGCSFFVEQSRRLILLQMIDALRQGESIDFFQCFVQMGLDQNKLSHIEDELPELCSTLFLPFTSPRVFDLKNWNLSEKINLLLAEKRWWFRAAGSADFVFLLRAFQGVCQQIILLNINLPWGPLLDFSVGNDVLAQSKKIVIHTRKKSIPLEFNVRAKKLCVQVLQEGKAPVNIEMPAEMVLDLKKYIPVDVLNSIDALKKFDFDALSLHLSKQGVYPQQLLNSDLKTEKCKIWLK